MGDSVLPLSMFSEADSRRVHVRKRGFVPGSGR